MDAYLVWLIAGFVLVISELTTGTFYLLVLGISGFVGAGVAYAGGNHLAQTIVAGIFAIAGTLWVHRHRHKIAPPTMRGLDVGQPATFESWIDKSSGHARVKYRDAQWDAQISGDASGDAGEIFYIIAVDGNTLKISKTRPA
jgi:membrane protein implicated in regulation of membrane protease activity